MPESDLPKNYDNESHSVQYNYTVRHNISVRPSYPGDRNFSAPVCSIWRIQQKFQSCPYPISQAPFVFPDDLAGGLSLTFPVLRHFRTSFLLLFFDTILITKRLCKIVFLCSF